MNIERMERGAKAAFGVLSVVSGLAAAAGVVLLALAIGHTHDLQAGGTEVTTGDMLTLYSPLIMLMAFGFVGLAAALAWRAATVLLFRNAIDTRYRFDQLLTALEQQKMVLDGIKEVASLSDASKQIAFRQKDREALRLAIKEDLARGDTDSALQLLNEMARRFGYQREAEEIREQIESGQRDAVNRQVRDAIEHIDDMISRFNWPEAQKEVDRILRQFPSHPDVRQLPERVQTAKDSHKRELLKQWKDAVARDDVDRSVELLRQLDQYILPSEAEAYKEAARGVFRKKLQQLGVQFALHTHDKNHIEALRIAQQIIEEFPNSRMATELKDRMDILTERAHQPAGV
jgi:hypothetical protein